MKRILVAMGDIPPPHSDGLDILRTEMQVDVATHLLTEDELVQRIGSYNAVLLGAPRLTRRVLLAADNLELISRGGIGVDNIDIPTATEKGVVVTNVLDTLSKTVAEHTFMFILGITRDIVVGDRSVRTGRWKEFAKIGHHEIIGKTIGIIGFGGIGVAVADIARKGFEMKVLTNQNRHLRQERIESTGATVVSLDELLRQSDYVVLCVPLNSESERMIGERELALMKPGSYLINVARGKVVDQDALYRALSGKRIAGAALDVLTKQPPDPDDPLLKLDNVIFTPHDAAITLETGRYTSILIANSILDIFHGRKPSYPVNLLNPRVAEAYLRKVGPGA
ncbi:MAG: NAD(P)-binding domain-containing protein [Thaumarchaeota archaeon]|nr:NAD(P)-binding domain-containing protein [Nitrososphaerota archaeon]